MPTIYIERDFDADTLTDLRRQALAVADEAWREAAADEALRLWREEGRKAGLLPEPAKAPYDVTGVETLKLWEKAVAELVPTGARAAGPDLRCIERRRE